MISRVQRIPVFLKTVKLKLILTGCVLLEGTTEASLSLEDFSTGEKVAVRSTPCPNNNVGLIAALKNLQMVMQIVFSKCFETCLESFIQNLEGSFRPMELVAADFLKYAVELTLRKIFRIIRSVKSTSLEGLSVRTPELCAALFITPFDALAEKLSDHQSMTRQDAYFRIKVARSAEWAVMSRVESTPRKVEKAVVKFNEAAKAGKVPKIEKATPPAAAAGKICSGHFGKQITAIRKDGRPYVSSFDKNCVFGHPSISGKSNDQLVEIASAMPKSVKEDFLRAISAKKS